MSTTRRDFLRTVALASAALALPGCSVGRGAAGASDGWAALDAPFPGAPAGTPAAIARDERYWSRVASFYEVTDRTTNMEAGYFGMMARPVLRAYHRNIDRVNRESSFFARTEYGALAAEARRRTAEALGIAPGELAFSRNATEALQALIGQYNRLRPGDGVMYADLDYPAMQQAMNALAARSGAHVATLDIPEPASRAAVLDAYEAAFDANPGTRLLLLTHTNNKTGLIHPVPELARRARTRGIEVIVDAAHSFGHVPLAIDDLEADFVGINLHKWVGAPVGVGGMIIREAGLPAIDPAHGDPGRLDRIDSRLHTGTMNFAAIMTIPDALDVQDAIGMPNKAARLRWLRDAWVGPAREIPGVDILTPDDADLVGALTSIRLHGDGSREGNLRLARSLSEEFGLFTVYRSGLAKGDCVRITPSLYNSPDDGARLVEALTVIARRG